MERIVNSKEMQEIDRYTIQDIGISALVLMERAAMKVAACVKKSLTSYTDKVLCVCGIGNNGGDGIAVARLLTLSGVNCDYYIVGKPEHGSKEFQQQYEIAKKLNLKKAKDILDEEELKKYTIIVDALFGTGLNRTITGEIEELINRINAINRLVISVDIPSGIDTNTGKIWNVAVKAQKTITFGLKKLGLCLYPGAEYAGEIFTEDIGFPEQAYTHICSTETFQAVQEIDLPNLLPKRKENSNKGSYGRVLIIAGSEEMTGAAVLAAEGAYRIGTGLVKVLTSPKGVHVIRNRLPEALTQNIDRKEVLSALSWADAVVFGSGIGMKEEAQELLDAVLENVQVPLVLDADALNLLSKRLDESNLSQQNISIRIQRLAEILPKQTILTPHLKELSRLLGCSMEEISGHIIDIAKECTYNNKLVFVLKDARTVIASEQERYLNLSGNHGMATGGSGDILAGMIGGLLAGGLTLARAAALGVFLHGRAGDYTAKKKSKRGMLAGDILEGLTELFLKFE